MDKCQVAYQDDQVVIPPDIPLRLHISNNKLIELRRKGLSYSQMEKITGVDSSTIFCRLKSIGYRDGDIDNFKTYRADILAFKQVKLLKALNDDVIKDMAGRDLVVATGILYDKERLERGLATNINGFEGLQDGEVEVKLQQLSLKLRGLGVDPAGFVGCQPQIDGDNSRMITNKQELPDNTIDYDNC